MKIIGKDNWARESVADFLACDNVRNEYIGKIIVEALNAGNEDGPTFYELVPDDYRLWRGMEELI